MKLTWLSKLSCEIQVLGKQHILNKGAKNGRATTGCNLVATVNSFLEGSNSPRSSCQRIRSGADEATVTERDYVTEEITGHVPTKRVGSSKV